jgi:uncharacterized protein
VRVRIFIALLSGWLTLSAARCALPPAPQDYVVDEAGVFTPVQKEALARKLEQFERETSEQLLVVVYPAVPDGEVMEDFTQRTAEAWGVGNRKDDSGMVLFVFPQSRQLRVEVGYGLEGAVPDALASRIINDEIVPFFRAGDLAGGIEHGADALMSAARGEYTGTGRIAGESEGSDDGWILLLFLLIFLAVVLWTNRPGARPGGTVYTPSGRRDVWIPSGRYGGGGGFGGGGFGGGGFTGGGGSFGGGGASGRW